jgi:CRP-like cAMP-binding protein/membrane protease YdiL (CAAX protease family)
MALESAVFDGLRDHFLFSGLSDAERSEILDQGEVRECGAGDVILTEDQPNSRLFIVLKGEVEVLKLEPTTNRVLPLSTIREGGLFGELSFFNEAPCTATVKAIGGVTLLMLDRKAFHAGSAAYDNLVASMAGTNLARLDATNAKYVKSAVDYLEALRTQNEFGKFFIITIVTFGLGNLLNRIVSDYVIDTTTDLYSWAYLLIILTPILYFVLYFRYPLSMFGVHLHRWQASVRDGVVSGAIGVFLFLGGYWLFNRLSGTPLQQNLLAISDPRLLSPTVALYLGHSYIQEFIARGVIQTSLQKFLNETKGRQTVLLTSFLFAVFHLHISIAFSLIVFVGSMVFGFLYLRTENLIGVSILHWLLGLASIQAGLM